MLAEFNYFLHVNTLNLSLQNNFSKGWQNVLAVTHQMVVECSVNPSWLVCVLVGFNGMSTQLGRINKQMFCR